MKTYIIADTHFNHTNIVTYCDRPDNFTERIIKNWQATVKPEDLVIHLGDVFIGKPAGWDAIWPLLPGRKVLVEGNHDKRSSLWWMRHGFEFSCKGLIYQKFWFTHKPACGYLPDDCTLNIHGHLHNIWHGFHSKEPMDGIENTIATNKRLIHDHQRLFAIEYTDYYPVELEKFVAHPDRYQAKGPKHVEIS